MLKKVKSLGKALRLTKKDEVAGLRRSMSEEDAQLAPTYKFRSSGELTALTMLVEETRMRLGLLGGKSVARVRCSEALEDILAVLTEQRAGLDRLEFAADAGERAGVAHEEADLFARAWGAIREELAATSDAVTTAQRRIALLPGGSLSAEGPQLPSMAKCAELVENSGLELKAMAEGVLSRLPLMPEDDAGLSSPHRSGPQSITPVSQADTELGHERYLSERDSPAPSGTSLHTSDRGGSTSPLEPTVVAHDPPGSPAARPRQAIPPPSPFDAAPAAAPQPPLLQRDAAVQEGQRSRGSNGNRGIALLPPPSPFDKAAPAPADAAPEPPLAPPDAQTPRQLAATRGALEAVLLEESPQPQRAAPGAGCSRLRPLPAAQPAPARETPLQPPSDAPPAFAPAASSALPAAHQLAQPQLASGPAGGAVPRGPGGEAFGRGSALLGRADRGELPATNYALALAEFEAAAAAGSADGKLALAKMLLRGIGAPRDAEGAQRLLEEVVTGGAASGGGGRLAEDAQMELALIAEADRGPLAAEDALWRLAAGGHAGACLRLADLIERGMLEPRGAAGEAESVEGLLLRVPARGGGAERGVAYNMLGMRVLAGEAARPAAGAGGGDAAAVAWFRRASAEGNGAAMHNLGVCIEDGRGAAADAGEARAWYRRAAAHGSAAGQNSLGFGLMCEGRHTEARAALELAVAQGNSDACFNLGSLLEHGAGGAPDAARAQQLYEAASAAGCPKAMHRLGNMLYSGVAGAGGDGASRARAIALFSRAAALGHAEAGNCAGLLLEAGEGVQADAARARDAYATAAARGSAAAAYNLAALHEKERDVPAALRALRRAEELGHPAAALDIERVRACADERRAAEASLDESCSAHSSASALDGVLPGADVPGADPGTL